MNGAVHVVCSISRMFVIRVLSVLQTCCHLSTFNMFFCKSIIGLFIYIELFLDNCILKASLFLVEIGFSKRGLFNTSGKSGLANRRFWNMFR